MLSFFELSSRPRLPRLRRPKRNRLLLDINGSRAGASNSNSSGSQVEAPLQLHLRLHLQQTPGNKKS